MLTYNGIIECTPPLTSEEVKYLNLWQQNLNEIYNLKKDGDEKAYEKLDSFIGFELTDAQRWTICQWSYSPMISWSEKGMEVQGTYSKGQFREAVYAYLHLLIGEEPVIKNALYKELSFLKNHTFNGIIESVKDGKEWLYVIEDNVVSSVNAITKEEYLEQPDKYFKETKDDTCLDKLNRYFPPLYLYAKITKDLYSNAMNHKEIKRSKI